MTDKKYKRWTMPELKTASELWGEGWSSDEIAAAIGRSKRSVRNQVERDRLRFPRRRRSRIELGERGVVNLNFKVPTQIHHMVKEQARVAGKSIVMVIMDALEIAHYYGFQLPDEVTERRRKQALADRRYILNKANEAEKRRRQRGRSMLVPYAGAEDE